MTDKENTGGVSTEILSAGPSAARETLKETPAPSATSSKEKTKRKRKRRRKRVRVGDALRCEGLDERDVAQRLKDVIERQISRTGSDGANDKLLAEMLMNCFRYLEEAPPRPAGKQDGKIPAKLLHDIPRPQRAAKTTERKGKEK